MCVDPDSGWDDEDNDVTWLVCTLCANPDSGINSSESSSKSQDDWVKTQGHCNGQSFVPSQDFWLLLLLKKQLKAFLFKKAFNLLE